MSRIYWDFTRAASPPKIRKRFSSLIREHQGEKGRYNSALFATRYRYQHAIRFKGAVVTGQFAYKPYLDGLRAVAVWVVLFYHLDMSWMPGGFLGVDVFFVLSGYLITTLLLLELDDAGRISFTRFYARRARRLLPALFLVVLVVTVFGVIAFPRSVQAEFAKDALATVFYVANWFFIHVDRSYFDEFADPSPFRHMWSLAVEEQFYVFWPIALWLLPASRVRILIVGLVALVSVALLAWSFDAEDPTRAYFGTDTRAHQPLIGSLLALLVRYFGPIRLPRGLSEVLFVALAGAFVLLEDTSPAYYFGLSTLLAVCVAGILAGLESTETPSILRRLLSQPAATYLGRISYGSYLWHWPIIIALHQFAEVSNAARVVLTVGLTFVLSALSFHLLEQPIRSGLPGRWGSKATQLTLRSTAFVMGAVALLVSLPLLPTFNTWSPTQPDPQIRLAVVGDSISRNLAGGFQRIAQQHGWEVVAGGMDGCGVAARFQVNNQGEAFRYSARCVSAVPETLQAIRAAEPDVVFWHSRRELLSVLEDGQVVEVMTPAHDALILESWEQAVEFLDGIRIVVLEVVHNSERRPGQCRQFEHLCGADDGSDGRVDHLNSLYRQLDARFDNVELISVTSYLCPDGPPCPVSIDGERLRYDGFHFTDAAADLIAARLSASIKAVSTD